VSGRKDWIAGRNEDWKKGRMEGQKLEEWKSGRMELKDNV